MPRTINSEVSVFDFAGTVKDVKDAFTRDMVSENTETSTVASKSYSAGETFIWTDRKVYKAKSAIASGATLNAAANGNIEAVGDLADAVVENKEGLESVSDLVDYVVNHQGAKNLLPNNATNQVINGITFTVNSDGSVKANGTSTSNLTFKLADFHLKAGNYIISDDAIVTSDQIIQLVVDPSNAVGSSATRIVKCSGNDRKVMFTVSADVDAICYIWINSGTTLNNLTFKPVIRPAEIEDDTYVPYAMTNRELTEREETEELTTGISGLQVARYGKHVNIHFTMGNAPVEDTNAGWKTIYTLPERFRPKLLVDSVVYENQNNVSTNATIYPVRVNNQTGAVQVWLFPDKLTVHPVGFISYFTP